MQLIIISYFFLALCQGQNFNLVDNFQGQSFFDNFDFSTIDDPAHGFVEYVTKDVAFSSGYVKVNPNNQIYIGTDSKNVVQSSSKGRQSVRLKSKKQYRGGLFIFDLQHMPEGCGTWPSFTMYGDNWPQNGAIDILEGVNALNYNSQSLHTTNGCTMDPSIANNFEGNWSKGIQGYNATNCYILGAHQYFGQGCSIDGGSYGSQFNQEQGGVLATYWDVNNFINIWNFPSYIVPSDIKGNKPNPSTWGKPMAQFQIGTNCTASHFGDMNVVINLDFCGNWAGQEFDESCPGLGKCVDFVRYNPGAFKDAYWLVNSLKIFTQTQNTLEDKIKSSIILGE